MTSRRMNNNHKPKVQNIFKNEQWNKQEDALRWAIVPNKRIKNTLNKRKNNNVKQKDE
jgi:hypothetical protein